MEDIPKDPNMESNPESQNFFEERTPLAEVRIAVEKVTAEIKKVIVGQNKMVQLLLAAVLSGGHVLIEGNPGLGKTLTAKLIAKCIDTKFSRIQFTPDLMPSDLLGTNIFNLKTSEFEFKKGPVFSNIILIDEINRAPAKTQSALFELMEERQVTMDGVRYKMKEPFIIIGTQNPVDMEGTYSLPEAQMDRFLVKITVSYPSLLEETEILQRVHSMKNQMNIDQINPVLTEEQVIDLKDKVRAVHVDDELIAYIAKIVHKTREHKDIMIGASPRASISIMKAAKAIAVMRGRDFVSPDDILFVAIPVLGHRISLTPEKEMEGYSNERVIDLLLKSEEIPR